jgi:hypothetical protein
MPEQLLLAGSAALPMMLTAVCYSFGISKVDLNDEIDRHTATLRRALKNNLGVPALGRSPVFKNKKHYEDTLLAVKRRLIASGERITQETVAAALANISDRFANCDGRTVRKWNKDFSLDWKSFSAKRSSNRRKLA